MSEEFCQSCGAKITGKTGFCSECGAPINIQKINNNINEANVKNALALESKLQKATIIGYICCISAPLIYWIFHVNWESMGMIQDWIMLSVPVAIIGLICGLYVISKKSKYRKHGIVMLAILIILFWIFGILYVHS